MKLRMLALGFVLGLTAALATSEVTSSDQSAEDEKPDYMELWRQYGMPGKHHEVLAKFVGEWDSTTKYYNEGPDGPAEELTVTLSSRMIFGGRFLETRMAGTMELEVDDAMMTIPVEAIAYTGYNTFRQKYVSVYINAHNTGIYYSEGRPSEDGKTITYYSEWGDWETGEDDKLMMMVDRLIDENTTVTEFYDMTVGPIGALMMEMRSKRRK